MKIEQILPIAPAGRSDQVDSGQAGAGSPAAPLTPAASEARDRSAEWHRSLASLGEMVKPYGVALEFSRDSDTGAIVAKLVDKLNGETVRQIPSEVSLKIAAEIAKFQGHIIDRQA